MPLSKALDEEEFGVAAEVGATEAKAPTEAEAEAPAEAPAAPAVSVEESEVSAEAEVAAEGASEDATAPVGTSTADDLGTSTADDLEGLTEAERKKVERAKRFGIPVVSSAPPIGDATKSRENKGKKQKARQSANPEEVRSQLYLWPFVFSCTAAFVS